MSCHALLRCVIAAQPFFRTQLWKVRCSASLRARR
ncbi:hypothetical protein XHC_0127 [Xanthomonas hortorum pv. carotae str. M081]|nr:hypothetical protein XHC_0127 [Xanthomonas hortorum pv. carotae str. M081]